MRVLVTMSGEPTAAMASGDLREGLPGGPAVEARFCLVFGREALGVPVMRRMLGDILRALGVDHDSVSDILLAATEACTNVLRHGGSDVDGYAMAVTVGMAGCHVEVAEVGAVGSAAARRRWIARRAAGVLPRTPQWPTVRSGWHRCDAAAAASDRADTVDVAQLPESGRGLDVMRAVVDDVTLRRRPGERTVVTMRKRIDWADDAPLARLRAAS